MKHLSLLLILLLAVAITNAQNRNDKQFKAQQKVKLIKMAEETRQHQVEQKAEAIQKALQMGWIIRQETDEGVIELMKLDENGFPEHNITHNLNAARTSETDHLWPGGLSGLDLTGSDMLIGEWDAGGVLTTHQEFNDGGVGRVTQMDTPPNGTHYHSTHVAGTLIAEGQNADAHGMAPEAELHAYEWNDDMAEMLSAVANDDLIISNHSYGYGRGWDYESDEGEYYWRGNTSISATEDYKFGFYGDEAHDWDEIAHNAPQYLICKSAGNDRNDDHNGGHYVWSGGTYVWSTASRDPDGGDDGYDCLGNRAVAKNLMTVGAVWDIPGGYDNPGDVILEDYSSFGPTDDGRIKPDIVANGHFLESTDHGFNSDYRTISGTSMSSPVVTGTLTLIQEYYEDFRGGFMNAAVLKGLALNTAHECGPNDGPDYRHGWGLLNATGMADLVTRDQDEGGLIVETKLLEDQMTEYTYYCDGTSDINVTICWNDPPHAALTASLNPNTLTLVNDLNLRILDEAKTVYYPWVLHPFSPANAATKNDNFRDNVETVNIKDPEEGYYTVRIYHTGTLQDEEQTYALIINGMTTPATESYCESQHVNWDAFEYIQNVSFGDIDNSSGRSPGGYSNYTGLVTEMDPGSSQTIDVTVNGYNGDRAAVFVDWNRDDDFGDAGEEFSMGTGSGPFSTIITVPDDASFGYTTMRVVLCYNTAPTPCSNSAYGETEDYTINVGGDINVWTGAVSNLWHNGNNWSQGHRPFLSEDAIVTTAGFHPPVIDGNQEACRDLIIEAGAGIDVDEGVLSIFGNADIHGNLSLLHTSSDVFIYGDVVWHEGATGSMTGSATIDCEGDWYFEPGADVQFSSGYVEFSGPGTSWIVCKEDDCHFNHIRNYKTEILGLAVSVQSTADIHVDGNLYNYSEAILYHFSTYDFIINGFLNNMGGHFYFSAGTLVFNGNPSVALKPHTDCYLNNLVVNTTAPLTLADDYSSNLYVHGNLSITGGSFAPGTTGNFTVYVRGDWNNMVGPAGFAEAWSSVIFDGDLQYMLSDETFNLLEVACDDRLLIGDHTVVCSLYNYTSGGIGVSAGTFTANDLDDQGVIGFYAVSEGGTINITNDFVDLMGDLSVYGGTVNLYGNLSWWPYQNDASLIMTHGVIDMKTCGISIKDNTHSFTDAISGGTIRTVGNFRNERADVNLSNVSIEMYGPANATLNLAGGSSIKNLHIEKIAKDGLPELKQTDREGKLFPGASKANNVSLTADASVENAVNIFGGSFTFNGYTANVNSDFVVHDGASLIMDNPDDVLNINGEFSWLDILSGGTANLSAGNIYTESWVIPREGCSFTAGTSNTITFVGTISGYSGPSCYEPSAVYGNIVIDKDPGLVTYVDLAATQAVIVDGDFTVNAGNIFEIQNNTLIVHGNYTDYPTSELWAFKSNKENNSKIASTARNVNPAIIPLKDNGAKGGVFEVDNFLTINGTLDVRDGSVFAHDFFEVAGTGSLLIDGGSFICDVPYEDTKAWNNIRGNFEMTDGLFEITYNSPRFSPGSSSVVSGGIIRSGAGFMAQAGADFNPTGGLLEMTGHIENPNLYCSPGNTLYNLLITCPEGHTVHYYYNTIIQNNLTMDGGNLECAYQDDSNLELYVGGNWTNNSGGFIPNMGTVIFNGSEQSQITRDETFYNLTIDKTYSSWDDVNLNPGLSCTVLNDFTTITGTLNLDNNTTFIVENDVLLGEGSGLNAFNNYGLEIFVGGKWTNENTYWDTFDGYSPGSETLTFNGSEDQFFTSVAPREEIGNLVINKPDGEFKPESNINLKGDLVIEDGIWKDEATGLTHYFEGDFTASIEGGYHTVFTDNTAVFKGGADQTIDFPFNGYFSKVIVDKTEWPADKVFPEGHEKHAAKDNFETGKWTCTLTMLSDVDLEYGDGLVINFGTLLVNGFSLTVMGGVEVNDGGKLVLEGASRLKIDEDDYLRINEGGIFHAVGEPDNKAIISHYQEGFYGLEVMDGGVIRAIDATFEYIGADWFGLHIREGAFIDPSYAFTNCTFQHGVSGLGGSSFITINNDQTLTIMEANFPEATADCNVAKDNNSGHITFVDYTGDFSGEMFEFDPHNRIDWYEDELTVAPPEQLVGPEAGTTTFTVTSNVDWTVSESLDWLSVDPMSGTDNGILTVDYDENFSIEERIGEITISAGGVEGVVVAITQEAYPSHQILVPAGWSGLSSYIMPAETDITDVMGPIASDLTILQTMDAVYFPAGPINTIGTWEAQSAYKIKLTADAELTIVGDGETNKTVGINAGWNLLPVICNTHVNAADLILDSDIVILKEVAGTGILWPEYEINTLEVLTPGKAYFALSSEIGSLTFPPNAKNAFYGNPETFLPYHPWNGIHKGPSTHSIAILSDGFSGLMPGDVIGIFDKMDNCFGAAEIKNLSENAIISAFADDPFTYNKDGFVVNEQMSLKLFRLSSSEVYPLEVVWDDKQASSALYENEGTSVISSFKVSNVGINQALTSSISIHPNPTNGIILITGILDCVKIEIYSSGGEMVKSIIPGNPDQLKLNLSDLPAGIYYAKILSKKTNFVRKLIKQ